MRQKTFWATAVAAVLMLLGSTQVGAQAQSDKQKIYECKEVDVAPEFPGGRMAAANFLCQRMAYPKEAMKARKEGVVKAEFIVERDGSITNIKLTESVCESLDAEALRIVRLLPKYSPGKKGGKTVRTRMILPVTFRLN